MRWLCALLGHRLNPPVVNGRGRRSHRICGRCDCLFLPDYYDGWRRATPVEREIRLRAYHRGLADEQPAE